jgi:PAS domain S-box-containing protein
LKTIAFILTLIAAFALYLPAFSQNDAPPPPEPLILNDQQDEYPLGLNLEILEDPTGELTIEDVTSPEFDTRFVPSQVPVPNYGFTDSVYWVRLHLDNQTQQTNEWLLKQGFANTHFIDLYTPLPDGKGFTVKQTGVLRPTTTRDIQYPDIVFNLTIPPQSQGTYYLRFQSGASMTLPLTLWTQNAFLDRALLEQILMGIFYGVLIGLLFYNLFLLFSFRELNYLFFVLLLVSLIFEDASYAGYLPVYIIPNLVIPVQYIEPLAFPLLIGSMILFTDSFLEVKRRLPKFHAVFLVLLAGWGALMLLIPFASYHILANLMLPWAVVSILAVFVAGIASWRGGYRPSRFFLLAWLGLLISMFWLFLVRLGLASSSLLSENAFRLGYLWMAVCWAIALADRINLLKAEKEKANLEVQASEARYRKLVETMNDGLGMINDQGRFTYINNRLAEMFGYPQDEIIGHLVTDFTDQENLQILARELQERRYGSRKPYELTWQRKDGSQIFTILSPVPLFEDGGRYKGAFAVVTDITERVQASRLLEQRVDERTQELTTLLGISRDISASRDLIIVLDRMLERLKTVVDYRGFAILAEEDGKWRILDQDWPTLSAEPDPIELTSSQVQEIVNEFAQEGPIQLRDADLDKANGSGFGALATRLSGGNTSNIRCWLGVPLFEKESIFGALVLGFDEAGASEDQVKVIVASTNQLAIAIENNHLYQQIRDSVMSEERNRLARELHDSVTQVLFSATLLADVLPQIWRRNPEQGLQKLDKLRQLTRGALAEMRTMLLELRPAAVVNTPMGDLLAQLAEAVTSRTGLSFQLLVEQIPPLPENVQINIYRIAQEALNNVVKHAQARSVIVSLSATPLPVESTGIARYEVRLVVQDDGVGFPSEGVRSDHMGIGIMHERAAAIQASLTVESRPGYGTQVTLIWRSQSENGS